jgi:hypothetical protein
VSGQPDFSTAPRPRRAPVWERLALAVACAALLSGIVAWRARGMPSPRARLAEVRREVEAASGRLRAFEAGPGRAALCSQPRRHRRRGSWPPGPPCSPATRASRA